MSRPVRRSPGSGTVVRSPGLETGAEGHHEAFTTRHSSATASRRSPSASRRRRSSPTSRGRRAARARNLVVALSEWRQRRAQHGGAVQRSVLLQPPAEHRRAGRTGAADRQRQLAGKALGLHPRLTGLHDIFNEGRLAIVQRTGYTNSSRSHFQGTRHLGHRQHRVAERRRLARPLSRHAAVAARSAGRLEHDARDAARAADASNVGVPAIPDARSYAFSSPNSGAEAATSGPRDRASPPTSRRSRPHRRSQQHRAGRHSDARPRRHGGRRTPDSATYPNNGFAQALRTVAGCDRARRRHARLLGADRRLRHPRLAGQRRRRRLRQPDGARSTTACSRSTPICATRDCSTTRSSCSSRSSAAASRRTAARAPTTARPASCWRSAAACAAGSTARHAVARSGSGQPVAREQRRRRPLRNRLPRRLRARARQLARRQFDSDPRRRLPRPGPAII